MSEVVSPMSSMPTEAERAESSAPVQEGSRLKAISYRKLLWLRFKLNRLALLGMIALILIYGMGLFAEIVAPYRADSRTLDAITVPPQLPRFIDTDGRFHLRPFVYELKAERDKRTFERIYVVDTSKPLPLYFWVEGEEYKFFGISGNRHLFGVEGGRYFALGTDSQGRDLLSRIIYGGRISTTVGLLGVFISLLLGITVGMLSGLVGGWVDQIAQRSIEVLLSFPAIPLWLALSAVLPREWSPLRTFFAITIILSVIGWGSLARVVRGMTLSLRNEEYVLAAQMGGGGIWWILWRHLLPANLSYVIVAATLAVPNMILGETALSFLGLGLRPPIVSWGVLLQDAQKITNIGQSPWLILPVLFLAVTVLAFNFVGDGLRDAIDPRSRL